MKKKRDLFAWIMLCLGLIATVAVLVMTFLAIRRFASEYAAIRDNDLSQDTAMTMIYDDHLYAQIAYGIEIVSGYQGMDADRNAFLETSLRGVDQRILSCGTLYTMVIATVLSYFLYRSYKNDAKKHVLSVVLMIVEVFAVYVLVAWIAHLISGMPFYFGRSLFTLTVSLLSIIGGSCALALLYRFFRFKKIMAVAAIPLVLVLFLFGFAFEHGLYCEPIVESFDYVAELDPRILEKDFAGPVYYDEEKNVMVVEGKEYEAQQLANEERYTGLARIGAYAYELLDPYAGNSLYFWEDAEGSKAPLAACFLYLLKSLGWIFAALLLKKVK